MKSFCEVAPKLLCADDVHYLLSEVFSQDSLEAYFSRQRHCRGKCDNPSVDQFFKNTASLVQQREVYRDLKTMNIKRQQASNLCSEPFPNIERKKVAYYMQIYFGIYMYMSV